MARVQALAEGALFPPLIPGHTHTGNNALSHRYEEAAIYLSIHKKRGDDVELLKKRLLLLLLLFTRAAVQTLLLYSRKKCAI